MPSPRRTSRSRSLFAIGLLLRTAVALAQPQGQYIDGIIANVGGRIVLYSDLMQRVEQMRDNGPVNDELTCTALESLLYDRLLLEQARIDSVVVDESQVESELDQRIQYFARQMGGIEQMEKFYGKSQTEIKADFRDDIQELLLVRQMQQRITGDVRTTPKEVEAFYNTIPKDSLPFINAGVEYARIVRYAEPSDEEDRRVKKRLEEFRENIVKGTKDFCTIAVLYSEDPGSASKCGELGMVPAGLMAPEFDAVALSLKDGEISQVFKTQFGYHIMQMIDRKGERYNARHILLTPKTSTEDMRLAKVYLDSVATLIRDGKIDFSKAAADLNDDEETKGSNGLVIEPNNNTPRWSIKDLDQRTFSVLDKLVIGQISEPQVFEDEGGKKGYRLLRLTKRTEPHVMDLVEDYPLVQRAAEQKSTEHLMNGWLEEKLSGMYVHLIPDYAGCHFEHRWVKSARP